MPRKLTTDEFIRRAQKIHGNKYDYSQVVYINRQTKIKIFCKKCSCWFEKTPMSHIFKKAGCPKCKNSMLSLKFRSALSDFIKKAENIHGSKYDYSQVEYTNGRTKVEIFCRKCKEYFMQTPSVHLLGSGCPYCNKGIKSTKEHFIKRAQEIHGNKYNYDEVNYINSTTKVLIYCNECHKNFWQTPQNHLYGCGCQTCGMNSSKNAKRSNTINFIKKAKQIHKDKYNYSKVNYIGYNLPVEIKCNRCKQTFKQTPNHHLGGCGCPYCNFSKGEKKIKEWLENKEIIHELQKRFRDCRDKYPLPFDFYLPDFNICIEFQGQQHYDFNCHLFRSKSIEVAKQNFSTLQYHDQLKRDFCKKNGIKLIEIKYTDDINKILNNIY